MTEKKTMQSAKPRFLKIALPLTALMVVLLNNGPALALTERRHIENKITPIEQWIYRAAAGISLACIALYCRF